MSRPSIFNDDELDLSSFQPRSMAETHSVPLETVRRVSEEGGFPSRAPRLRDLPARPVKRATPAKTGRTELLNARITPRALERFHDIVEVERQRYEAGEISHRVTLGEVVEQALAALERERAQHHGDGKL